MEFDNQPNIAKIKSKFDLARTSQEQCKICIETINNECWNFYFQSGSLIWATTTKHRLRRLYRVIQKYCSEVNCQEIQLREKDISELWGYLILVVLYKRNQMSLESLQWVIHEIATEVLFDIFQLAKEIKSIEYVSEKSSHPMRGILKSVLLQKPLIKLDTLRIYSQAEHFWSEWLKADFASYSPNLSLIIKDSDGLESATNNSTYLKLTVSIEAQKTLRDLSVITKQDCLTLLRSFKSYVDQGYLGLEEVEDRYLAINSAKNASRISDTGANQQQKSKSLQDIVSVTNPKREIIEEQQPLIICIDDSPIVCDLMCKIINNSGCRFISIQESIKALTILLEQKPDLIFLDLVMPITNGHELCSQIRRISLLKDTPIVILTGNDGVIDRVRAKVVGASEFISKPIESDKIKDLIHKYCFQHLLVTNI